GGPGLGTTRVTWRVERVIPERVISQKRFAAPIAVAVGLFFCGTNPRAANCFAAGPTLPQVSVVYGHSGHSGPTPVGGAFLCHEIAVIGGRVWSSAGHQPTIWGQIMKRLTSAGLFASPKRARQHKARLEHAKLVVASAREHAAKTAQRYEEEWRKKKWR